MTGKAFAAEIPGAMTVGMTGGVEELSYVHVSGRIVEGAILFAAVAAARHGWRQ
jgi:hypothetical protein